MKSTYIYNFAVNTNWPSGKKSGDFIIGVYGNDTQLINALAMLEGRKIGSQSTAIKNINNLKDAEDCHILYITQEKQNDINTITNRLKGKNVLLILESKRPPGEEASGCGIGFYPLNNRWVFDINTKSLETQGLLVTSKLQNLANRITQY